jgi:hypothetical protein
MAMAIVLSVFMISLEISLSSRLAVVFVIIGAMIVDLIGW